MTSADFCDPSPSSHLRTFRKLNMSAYYTALTKTFCLSVLNILNIFQTNLALKNNNRLKTHVRIYSVRKCERRARNVVVKCASAAQHIQLFRFSTTTILRQRCNASFRLPTHPMHTRCMQKYFSKILKIYYRIQKIYRLRNYCTSGKWVVCRIAQERLVDSSSP